MSLEHLWAGWRSSYVTEAASDETPDCLFCALAISTDADDFVLWRGDHSFVTLNAFPYSSGHLMASPNRHVGEIEELTAEESTEIWAATQNGVRAIKSAFEPHGINIGMNLGRVAGAGFPGHVHVHAVPRWNGDTNFMTTVANTRVMPETLAATAERLRNAWPS